MRSNKELIMEIYWILYQKGLINLYTMNRITKIPMDNLIKIASKKRLIKQRIE